MMRLLYSNMNRPDILLRSHCKIFSQGPLQIEIIVKKKKSNRKTSVTLDISGWRGFNTQN